MKQRASRLSRSLGRWLCAGLVVWTFCLGATPPAAAQQATAAKTAKKPEKAKTSKDAKPAASQDDGGDDGGDNGGDDGGDNEDALFAKPETRAEHEATESVGQRRLQHVDETPLEQMGRKDARQAGFVFGNSEEESSRTSATFLAATAGLFAHGIGHWYIDERRTAEILVSVEAASVGLMGSALLWRYLSDDSPASVIYARPAMYAGLGLFGLSYLLDVIGTMQNADIGMPPNTRRTQGISVQATYNYLTVEGYPSKTLQVLTAGSRVDLGWGYVGLRTDQDVFLDTSIYGLTLGSRPWRGPGRHTFVFADIDTEYFNFSGQGRFQRVGGQARVGVSLGLGNWISQLRNVAVGAAVGYGHNWYALPTKPNASLGLAVSSGYIPLETFVHFNLTDKLNVRLAYEHRAGELLQTTPAGLGVASAQFQYQSADMLDLVLGAQLGGGLGITGGLRVWLWP